jgi:hypothetical protein
MRKDFPIYEEMGKYFPIYQEAVSYLWLCNCSILNFLIYGEILIFFFISVAYKNGSWQTYSQIFPPSMHLYDFRSIYRVRSFFCSKCWLTAGQCRSRNARARKIFIVENRVVYCICMSDSNVSMIQITVPGYYRTIVHRDPSTKNILFPVWLKVWSFLPFKFKPKKLGGAIGSWLISVHVVIKCRLCMCYCIPYHTLNKSLVLEWPTFIDV